MNVLLGSAALVFAATPALAQERTLFTWTGRADQVIDVTIRGSSISQANVAASQARGNGRGGRNASAGNVTLQSALPQQEGSVRVRTTGNQGATVIQQPSAGNGYTAIVRLGNGKGRGNGGQVTAYWSPSGSVGSTGSGRNDRKARDRDDRDDRDKRGDRGRREDREGRDRSDTVHAYGDNGGYGTGNNNSNGGYNNGGAGALHWYGDVEGITQLTLRGAQLTITNVAGSGSRNVAGNEAGVTLPSRPTTVSIVTREGRGRIGVVQQPTAANGYTAIVRIVDAASGYGHYDFDIVWR